MGNVYFDSIGGGTSYSVKETLDSGYIFIASINGSFGQSDILLMKINSLGEMASWNKIIGGWSQDIPRQVIQTQDQGYVVAGTTGSVGSGSWDMFLLKTDSLGK
jgi:hypothetical protein